MADTHDTHPNRFEEAVRAVRRGADPFAQADQIYKLLTPEERLGLLDGDEPFWKGFADMGRGGFNLHVYPQGVVSRVGLPGILFTDGPRGVVIGPATAFPVPMARGATFDVELEERIGDVIGREARAIGANLYGGVCINLPRNPAWGRAQESFGDDPHHLGEFGAALVRGVQKHVMATAKHYALNSMENARFQVDVRIEDGPLHDVYLPHFKRVADEGVAAIMGAYNSVNGEWAGENETLLTTILRDDWGWDGITITDWVWGFRDPVKSLRAGMDLEEPFRQQRDRALPAALESGEISWEFVKRSGVRLIAAQIRSYATRSEGPHDAVILADDAARALAREAATRAMTLLRNEEVDGAPVLPIVPGTVSTIAVIGRLAVAANLGDHGSSDVKHTPSTSTPWAGITAAYPDAEVILVEDDDPAAAAAAAARADVAVIVAGYTAEDEGEYLDTSILTQPDLLELFPPMPEGLTPDMLASRVDSPLGAAGGGDRQSLRLRPVDERIIEAVAEANPRTVVAIVSAGTVIVDAWDRSVPGVLMMWYAGMEGGHALADVLTGDVNPSGRLPAAIPTDESHLPFFDRDATSIEYDRYHGQRLLDRQGLTAAYPYGFGLSYTTFSLRDARVERLAERDGAVAVTVENTGSVDGRQIVQVYGERTAGEHAGEVWLLGFLPVPVAAGESARAVVEVSLEPLALWDAATRSRVLPDPSEVRLHVGAFRHDPGSLVL